MDRGTANYPPLSHNFKCSYNNCKFTEANASTIMFWIHKVCPMDGWPQHRREEQNYMMFTIESTSETIPYYNRTMLTDTWFNTTVNYRIDSTVFMPNDALTRITKDTPKEDIWDKKEILEIVKGKTKLAFQAVSHCNAESDRDLLTKKIKEYIEVDVVGHCNGVGCNGDCKNREMKNHFFYLAFENSVCPNYVTEKFWNALRIPTVPVVITRSVFTGMDVPKNAFIALDDFNSVKELVEYMKDLRNNTEKYLRHFEWTKTYTKRHYGYNHSPKCRICEVATKMFEEKTKSVIDLNKFWNLKDCKNNLVKDFLNKG
uniref:Fucosyltransferase n=1 Tax=Meloidogyne javanica TaxID=6303 RepID=A0A915MF15_MELJA